MLLLIILWLYFHKLFVVILLMAIIGYSIVNY
jgi:hypothetical protein